MTITAHPYRSERDLYTIQAATVEWVATAGFRGYMNVSDIALRLFNGMRDYAPAEIVRIWENGEGQVIGWGMAYPAWSSYEALVHPDYRQQVLAMDILDWAERETIHQRQKAGLEKTALQVNIFDGDVARIALLEVRGYVRGEKAETISVCSLDDSLPAPHLPAGFSIRSLQGEHEVDKLVALVNDSFGWDRTVDGYRKVMRSPGYRAENERVVVAPDGRFAASCLLLPDIRNRSGMFENVSTHSAFRRRGLAKALLLDGMRLMKMQRFTAAMVPHGAELNGAAALYASAGFRPTYELYHYEKRGMPS